MIAAVLLLVLGPCTQQLPQLVPAGQLQPELPLDGALPDDLPVLRIDGETITWGEYSRWLVRETGERTAFEFALDDYVVEREAARRQVELDPQELQRAVTHDFDLRVEKAFQGRKEDWLEELRSSGRTEEGVRTERAIEARRELLASAIANLGRVVPEAKIQREWERAFGRHGRRYELARMQFRPEPVKSEKLPREEWMAQLAARKEDARERALAVRKRLEAGEDFATLAAQLSEDEETRLQRGSQPLGLRDPGWPDDFLDALEALPLGALSQPLFARGGWWLVRPLKVVVTPLADVRHALELDLIARGPELDEIRALEQRLREGVLWKVLPAMWSLAPAGERSDMLDAVLAIDGQAVSRGVYARFLCRTQGEALAQTFVESWLVERRARSLGLSVTLEQAEQRARERVDERVQDPQGAARAAWEEYLDSSGRGPGLLLHESTFRSLTDVLTDKMIEAERKPTPEELGLAYQEAYGKEGERIDLRLVSLPIVLSDVGPGWSHEEFDRRMDSAAQSVEARARELLAELHAGADFAALARAEGLRQERFRPERWSPEICAALRAAGGGEFVGPLRQSSKCFVFQVLARRKVAFEEARAELEQECLQRPPSMAELAAFRSALRRAAAVTILPGLSR